MDVKTAPWTRVAILLWALFTVGAISYHYNGTVFPVEPKQALIFQNALLLIVLGSALIEEKFTKPADSVVNSLMGIVTLLGVHNISPKVSWWVIFSFCSVVFLLATICTVVSTSKDISGWKNSVAQFTYRPAVVLGAARRLFSILFLYGIFTFYEIQSPQTISLVIFWGLFIVVWPLRLPQLLTSLAGGVTRELAVGEAIRTDWPNIIRAKINSDVNWNHNTPYIFKQSDGSKKWILPLYSQSKKDGILGTGICVCDVDKSIPGPKVNGIFCCKPDDAPTKNQLIQSLGGGKSSTLLGFVVEESSIGEINFEVLEPSSCSEGILVWCPVDDKKIFYQITHGINKEESLETERHGYQLAKAAQLGVLNKEFGFVKYDWVPVMNSPIFTEDPEYGTDLYRPDVTISRVFKRT